MPSNPDKEALNPHNQATSGDRRHMGAAAIASEALGFESMIDHAATATMHNLAREHGMSIKRGVIGNSPNDADFMATFGLNLTQLKAIGWYKGSGSLWNDHARGAGASVVGREHMEALHEMLTSPTSSLPVTKGGELTYRGTPLAGGGTEPGFKSTTYSVGYAASFARAAIGKHGEGYIERIILPPGLRYLPVGTSEAEIILPPKLKTTPVGLHLPGSPLFQQTLEAAGKRFDTNDLTGVKDCLATTA
jgi:hypothetical protein